MDQNRQSQNDQDLKSFMMQKNSQQTPLIISNQLSQQPKYTAPNFSNLPIYTQGQSLFPGQTVQNRTSTTNFVKTQSPLINTMFSDFAENDYEDESQLIRNYNSSSVVAQTQLSGKVSIASEAAKLFLASQGRKDGGLFVKQLTAHWPNEIDKSVLDLLTLSCKKYSMKRSEFDVKFAEYQEKGVQNLIQLGADEKTIAKSAPINAYKQKGHLLKMVLHELFWSKGVTEEALSWGNWVRIPWVENYLKDVRRGNQTMKPRAQNVIYSNSYWMVAEFQEAADEIQKRALIILAFVQKTANLVKFDERGWVDPQSVPNWRDALGVVDEGVDLAPLSADVATFKSVIKEFTPATLLSIVIMVDPRKLLQTKTVRMHRRNVAKQAQHINRLKVIGEFLRVVIFGCALLKKSDSEEMARLASMKICLDPRSEFGKEYYRAYQFIHTYIRSMKKAAFGGTGGANTRASDLDETYVGEDWNSMAQLYTF